MSNHKRTKRLILTENQPPRPDITILDYFRTHAEETAAETYVRKVGKSLYVQWMEKQEQV